MADAEVAVVGAGVVGSAVALALARRGVAVALLEAEAEPGLAASGTNSGILHTGFDSPPGELETELILRSAALRGEALDALDLPVLQCGAVLQPRAGAERDAVLALVANARENGVETQMREDGALEVPGETVTDPVAYTLGLAAAAERQGAELRTGFRLAAAEPAQDELLLRGAGGESLRSRLLVNCAGLRADDVARLLGDDSFEIYARKGEFLVFDPTGRERLERILLPVPTKRTKGVLVFPTIDGMVVAGPTAVDIDDKDDWSLRPEARDEILPKARSMWPALDGLEPVAAYAGLRPAGRGVNYLIGPSAVSPRLMNVVAIRSTGMSASLGIAERVCTIVEGMGVTLGPEQPLAAGARPPRSGPWWRRTAEQLPV
jgi:glycerol-3-phosphate dehydrogenase